MQGYNTYQQNYPFKAMDIHDYDSAAKTLTHKDSEFPLIINRNQIQQFSSFKNSASIIDLEVEPRDKSIKQADKQAIIQKMKEYLKERIRVFVYPNGNDSIYVGFKLYNIDQPIKLNGKAIIYDFQKLEQVKDNQDQVNSTKWVAELGYKLTYTPYNIQEQYENLKNECFFSFLYECSVATSTITVLVVRIADDKSVFVL